MLHRAQASLHRACISLYRARISLHRGYICCRYRIYAVYAVFAAYGWGPRAEGTGSVEGNRAVLGPTIQIATYLLSRISRISGYQDIKDNKDIRIRHGPRSLVAPGGPADIYIYIYIYIYKLIYERRLLEHSRVAIQSCDGAAKM